MNLSHVMRSDADTAEIAALIEVLHTTEHRLENMTSGEVDSVTDQSGRTLLLRRAQDQLRYDEAAKLSAVLNALPAQVALLDTQGRIVAVNETWRRFGDNNGGHLPGYSLGVDYLAVCDDVQGESSAEAHQMADGIRSVLADVSERFSLEYACHSPTEQRWFLMMVTPLGDNAGQGVVVMHVDISERKRAEQAKRVSEAWFKTMFVQAPMGMALIDSVSGQICQANARFAEIVGRSLDASLTMNWGHITHPDDGDEDWDNMALLNAGEIQRFRMEKRYLHPNGKTLWLDMTVARFYGEDEAHLHHLVMVQEITQRKTAEDTIRRLNRVHAVLSGINTLIVRVQDRDKLFHQACQIGVETGGFQMAIIAHMAPGATTPRCVASAGNSEAMLRAITDILASPNSVSSRLCTRAWRDQEIMVCNHLAHDPQVIYCPNFAEFGVGAIVALPLLVAGEVVGVLALFASEADFFQEDELALLTELAGDIGFAMDHIDKQERINYLAYYDALTGLANRTLFLERLTQYMRAAASSGHQLGLFMLDLERFKNINDSLGRQVGDELLRQVAQWLTRQSSGDASLIARVGSNHFVVVMPIVDAGRNVVKLLERWIEVFLKQPFRLDEGVFRISMKVGGALFPDHGTEADTLFKHAEAALKVAKANGERYLFYTPTMTAAGPAKLTMENQLRRALENKEFVVYYQPKVNLVSGKMSSAEALIRWNHPVKGLVSPAEFIPVLEETGLIHEVGRFVMRQAVNDYLRWRAAGLPAVRIAVNVSALQLRDRGFIDEVRQAIAIDAHAAAGLELEITESLIMENVQHSIASLQEIRGMGLSIAIDDFGTGFSSLSYLSKFPVNALKIDRSFVIEMTGSPEGLALVSTIISLAHALKLKVVAEGVETEEQSRLLRLLGCDEMQGYLFSRPVPGDVFESKFLTPKPGD